MSVQARLSSVSFHLPDLDEAFPKFVEQLEELQHSVLSQDGPTVDHEFQLTSLLAMQIFRREEEAMLLCRDKGAAVHKAAHRKFLSRLVAARVRFRSEGPSVGLAQDLRLDLVEWLVEHHRLMNSIMGTVVRDMVERSIRHHRETGTKSNPVR